MTIRQVFKAAIRNYESGNKGKVINSGKDLRIHIGTVEKHYAVTIFLNKNNEVCSYNLKHIQIPDPVLLSVKSLPADVYKIIEKIKTYYSTH
jgi:hypothetical protein